MDFTDPDHVYEIAYFDRGPIDPKMLILGGSWSAYWYNGHIYSSEIARGLDVLELSPTENLTQNEIDAAKSVRVGELNVQNQQPIVWPKSLTVAKAYVDQLERSKGLSSVELTDLRQALDKKDKKKLKSLAASLEKNSSSAKSSSDAWRMTALAEILKKPAA
jgi:hypothetical protein